MPPPDPRQIERLRYQLELFIDGSDRSAGQAQRIADRLQELLPPDEVVDAFVTTAAIFGDPDCPFYRTEDEMVRECLAVRRHLVGFT